VLELHAIASKKAEGGGRFAVAMTAQEHRRFLMNISTDVKQYYSMLGRVNAETSDCSKAEDRESIHEGIRRSVGFAKLGRMVFGVMEGWMEETLRGEVAASLAAQDTKIAMMWKTVLANVCHEQGRNVEAIELYESILEQKQSWDDSEGSNWILDDTLLANLAVLYQAVGRHQDSLRLLEKSFEFRRRTLPEMDPELGQKHAWSIVLRFDLFCCSHHYEQSCCEV
jgi:tetratricopeptide (TPR) repeat protein